MANLRLKRISLRDVQVVLDVKLQTAVANVRRVRIVEERVDVDVVAVGLPSKKERIKLAPFPQPQQALTSKATCSESWATTSYRFWRSCAVLGASVINTSLVSMFTRSSPYG